MNNSGSALTWADVNYEQASMLKVSFCLFDCVIQFMITSTEVKEP